MDQSFSMQRDWGAMNDGESDEVKRIFLEGNPYFLALTVGVSMLHSGEGVRVACGWGWVGLGGGRCGLCLAAASGSSARSADHLLHTNTPIQ